MNRIGKRHECTFAGCDKTFSTSGHLSRHLKIHKGEKKHVCPILHCESRFTRKDNMIQHFNSHKKRIGPGQLKLKNEELEHDGTFIPTFSSYGPLSPHDYRPISPVYPEMSTTNRYSPSYSYPMSPGRYSRYEPLTYLHHAASLDMKHVKMDSIPTPQPTPEPILEQQYQHLPNLYHHDPSAEYKDNLAHDWKSMPGQAYQASKQEQYYQPDPNRQEMYKQYHSSTTFHQMYH